MAHIYRVVVFLCCLAFSVSAVAFSTGTQYRILAPQYTFDSGWVSSRQEACDALAAVIGGRAGISVFGEVTGSDCTVWPQNRFSSYGTWSINERTGCPANSSLNSNGNGQCTCHAGYFERKNSAGDTICVKPDDRTPDQLCEDAALEYNSTLQGSRFMRAKGPLSAFADGALTCADVNGMPSGKGCKHWFTGDLGFKDDQGQSWTNGFSIALNKGDSRAGGSLVCNSTDDGTPPKEKPPPDDCKNGYKGQVNGVDVCIEAWTGDTEGNDWNRTTDGEGNQTDDETNIKCKGDQCTVTQTKTTTKQDGTTTTTTTTTENVNRQGYCARNPESSICRREDDTSGGDKGPATRPGGGSGGGNGPDGEGFCKENPDSPICQKSNFGGSCAASFTCEGDAIQCAIAKEQHIRACKLFDDESPESMLYEDNKGKEGNQTEELPGNETIDLQGRIDTSDAIGGGGCFGDLSVTVWGTSVSLPLSNLCQYLAMLGNILVAVSMLMAARIVTRG